MGTCTCQKVTCRPVLSLDLLLCDPKLVENCVCLLRNLSYQVHREIPQAERYQEAPPSVANNTGPHAASCFGAKKGKGEACFPLLRSLVQDGERKVFLAARVERLLRSAGVCLVGDAPCRALHAGGAGGGAGAAAVAAAAAAAGISVSSWAVKAESPADLGPSPLPPLFPVSVFSSVLPCLFSHDPVDISLLRFSSFISLLSFPSRVTHWKMSGSPEVSGIF